MHNPFAVGQKVRWRRFVEFAYEEKLAYWMGVQLEGLKAHAHWRRIWLDTAKRYESLYGEGPFEVVEVRDYFVTIKCAPGSLDETHTFTFSCFVPVNIRRGH